VGTCKRTFKERPQDLRELSLAHKNRTNKAQISWQKHKQHHISNIGSRAIVCPFYFVWIPEHCVSLQEHIMAAQRSNTIVSSLKPVERFVCCLEPPLIRCFHSKAYTREQIAFIRSPRRALPVQPLDDAPSRERIRPPFAAESLRKTMEFFAIVLLLNTFPESQITETTGHWNFHFHVKIEHKLAKT
jgi:hypothetical protein